MSAKLQRFFINCNLASCQPHHAPLLLLNHTLIMLKLRPVCAAMTLRIRSEGRLTPAFGNDLNVFSNKAFCCGVYTWRGFLCFFGPPAAAMDGDGGDEEGEDEDEKGDDEPGDELELELGFGQKTAPGGERWLASGVGAGGVCCCDMFVSWAVGSVCTMSKCLQASRRKECSRVVKTKKTKKKYWHEEAVEPFLRNQNLQRV